MKSRSHQVRLQRGGCTASQAVKTVSASPCSSSNPMRTTSIVKEGRGRRVFPAARIAHISLKGTNESPMAAAPLRKVPSTTASSILIAQACPTASPTGHSHRHRRHPRRTHHGYERRATARSHRQVFRRLHEGRLPGLRLRGERRGSGRSGRNAHVGVFEQPATSGS